MYSGKHEHDGLPLVETHKEFCPHGDGQHGSIVSFGGGGITKLGNVYIANFS